MQALAKLIDQAHHYTYNARGRHNVGYTLMSISSSLSRAASSVILGQLRTLRASIAQARNALMHFHSDRLDRDKLEPAARQVDALMNMFTGDARDPEQGLLLVSKIQSGVDDVTNPKSAEALRDARVDIMALLDALRAGGNVLSTSAPPALV